MKQIAQNYRSGELSLIDVPVPACKAGGVLIRTEYSLLSSGTEMMKLRESQLSLIGKARARPDQVRQVVSTMAQQGAIATVQKVLNKLDSYTPLGYSVCGRVVEVGAGVAEFRVGDRVAAAGNAYALHAEYNWVPRRLCVPVADGVDPRHAAFTTVAAIALQGVRQAEAQLGETACVIGLGLLGQILVQLLRSAGLRVYGVDIAGARCRMAEAAGAAMCGHPEDVAAMDGAIRAATNGFGADHVFLTAGGSDNSPVEIAARIARDRARVVDIGKCSLDLAWNDWYEKELELRFSRSYGPGRYDPTYEEKGIDYPIGYVRWTEERNLRCIVDMIGAGQLDLEPLISKVVPFAEAADAYAQVQNGSLSGLGLLFGYESGPISRRMSSPLPVSGPAPGTGQVRMGVIGAGNYASSMLLPHLARDPRVTLQCVATATGLSAANAARRFRFAEQTTDHRELLGRGDIDAVVIATRHSDHARMACEALRAGKAVFVEKPLGVDRGELASIVAAVNETGNDRITVGFNRRFSPMLRALKSAWPRRSAPHVLRYRVNAGPLASTSWYGDRAAQGTRFVGEGGHFLDCAAYWLDAEPVSVQASATEDDPDNILAIYGFADGSRAEIAYLTAGNGRFPKEHLEIMGEGKVAVLDNFRRAEVWHGRKTWRTVSRLAIDKGQKAEVTAFVDAVGRGLPMPIPLGTLLATSLGTVLAGEAAQTGRTIPIDPGSLLDNAVVIAENQPKLFASALSERLSRNRPSTFPSAARFSQNEQRRL